MRHPKRFRIAVVVQGMALVLLLLHLWVPEYMALTEYAYEVHYLAGKAAFFVLMVGVLAKVLFLRALVEGRFVVASVGCAVSACFLTLNSNFGWAFLFRIAAECFLLTALRYRTRDFGLTSISRAAGMSTMCFLVSIPILPVGVIGALLLQVYGIPHFLLVKLTVTAGVFYYLRVLGGFRSASDQIQVRSATEF